MFDNSLLWPDAITPEDQSDWIFNHFVRDGCQFPTFDDAAETRSACRVWKLTAFPSKKPTEDVTVLKMTSEILASYPTPVGWFKAVVRQDRTYTLGIAGNILIDEQARDIVDIDVSAFNFRILDFFRRRFTR